MNAGELVAHAREIERSWMVKKRQPEDKRRTPWMPSDIAQWLVLLVDAMAEQNGTRYLEVGCGPGGKLLIARHLFGLEVAGFDVDPDTVAAARELLGGDAVTVADALDWPRYSGFDIVFFNRVFRDPALQDDLEPRVWREMKPGAVVIAMNLNSPPAGWLPVTDDWEARRGVWQKP